MEGSTRPAIVGFTPNDWLDGWTSRGRILLGLAERGWPTHYSSGASTVWEIGSRDWRERPWLRTVARHGALHVDVPGRLLVRWPTMRLFDHIALAAHAKGLCGSAPTDGRPIALLFHPSFEPYVRHLKPRRLIYYVYDAYRLMPGWTDQLERHEQALVARADLLIAYSQGMLDCLPGSAARNGMVLSTGVDMQPFVSAAGAPPPPDLACIPHPRIGYLGRINQKLDYSLVLEIARRRPEWHWVFVGAIGASADGRFAADSEAEALWCQCRALPNVHALGTKPHEEIPKYLLHMDVNAMCYRTHGKGWWSEIFPLKSMEYLAAGKPIVSAPLKSMLQFRSNFAIASTSDEWIAAIEHALVAGGIGTANSRREVAAANSWDHKIDCLQASILDMLNDTSCPRRS
jgi:glycosyltransferase involved in cell wall biosynthesis